jgi:ketosteroid isomerase-like protein
MTYAEKTAIGRRLHSRLVARDWAALGAMLAENVVWTLPGDNQVSGEIAGRDRVIAHFQKIAAFGVDFKLDHILVSRDNVALGLHNTARRGDTLLDEHLATVCFLDGEIIRAIETYLSDVEGMNVFFA